MLVFDKWLEDIDHYEKTLSEMATASMDQDFKEELSAIEQWFCVLTEAERTSALYSLLNQATQVQIRFLIMVLQQQAQQDPLSDILSPANFAKDAMHEKMTQAAHLASPSFYRPSPLKSLDSSAVQQMFPDAAAALANQRAELNRKKSGQVMAGSTNESAQNKLHMAPKDDGLRTPWTPSFRKSLDPPSRPRSAEPTNSAGLKTSIHATPLRSPRTDLNATSAPYSPFGESSGGNWASMTNTPASAMFPQPLTKLDSVQQRLAMSDVPRSVSSSFLSNSPRIVLESDVRKFRKPSRSPIGPDNVNFLPSSPLMMYDENGQLMNVQVAQALSSPGLPRHQPSLSTPTQSGATWQFMNGSNGGYIYPSSSPGLSIEGGYMSDNSSGRKRPPQSKPVENPADAKLLSDIPAWLRQLRLHKYTENLKTIKWQDLVKMTEEDLESKGISALGARRKLMKAFETVNEALEAGTLKA